MGEKLTISFDCKDLKQLWNLADVFKNNELVNVFIRTGDYNVISIDVSDLNYKKNRDNDYTINLKY